MKVNFKMLDAYELASILNWSIKQTEGILPLSENTFNLYPELRGNIDINKDNTDIIYKLIKDRIEDFNKKNNYKLKEYELLWNKYHDKYVKSMEDYFKVSINKDISANLGLLPVCPRNIEDLSFDFDYCDDAFFLEIIMHEICHFYFFEKCKNIFKDWKYDDFDNPSLLWYLSEIVVDPILNRDDIQKIFKHEFRAYDNFYNIYINNRCIVDIIKDIFNNNDIEKSIKLGLEFLKDNEIEFRGKCERRSSEKFK